MVFSNALKATETRSGCFCCRSAYGSAPAYGSVDLV
jgi:hypothetical protein